MDLERRTPGTAQVQLGLLTKENDNLKKQLETVKIANHQLGKWLTELKQVEKKNDIPN